MRAEDIKLEWARILQNPPDVYYSMPHAKLIMLSPHRPERARWPIVGDGEDVKEQLYNIRRMAMSGALDRLWALGYEDGWLPEARAPPRTRGRTTQPVVSGSEPASTSSRARAKQAKPKKIVEVVMRPRKTYSRVPSETEEDEGSYLKDFSVSSLNSPSTRAAHIRRTTHVHFCNLLVGKPKRRRR